MDISKLPAVNAGLNATSGLLLILGYIFIRQRALTAHTMTMLTACGTTVLFFISYITYHLHHGVTRFEGEGIVRFIYFTILFTHTPLAILIIPLVVVTVVRALRGRFDKHMRIARVTLPLWLYVSVTGVMIYWMLYRL